MPSSLLGSAGPRRSSASSPLPFDAWEWLEAPLRRPFLVAGVFLLVFGATLGYSYLQPNLYQSSALIMIESSRLPDKLAPLAGENPAGRLQAIRREILSRSRLEALNTELRPYPEAPTSAVAVERLQADLNVNAKGTDAFTIEFVHKDSLMTQKIVARLATLFVQEAQKAREEEMEGATDFLSTELDEARRQLDGKEEALRLYKERNMGQLPEQTGANLSTLQRLQFEQQSLDQTIVAAQDRLDRLEAGRAAPAVGTGTGTDPRVDTSPEAELARLQAQLATLRTRYTDEHPDVRALLAQIESLGRRMTASSVAPPSAAADGPQLERARVEVRSLLARRDDLRKQIATFQARVESTPRSEQDLGTLTRDFNQLRETYYELQRKKLETQRAERLQRRWREAFRIVDEANLPGVPFSPRRGLWAIVGVVLGLAAGLGAAFAAEMLDPSVKTVRDLESAFPFPVLGRLPHLDAQAGKDAMRRLHRRPAR